MFYKTGICTTKISILVPFKKLPEGLSKQKIQEMKENCGLHATKANLAYSRQIRLFETENSKLTEENARPSIVSVILPFEVPGRDIFPKIKNAKRGHVLILSKQRARIWPQLHSKNEPF